MPIFQVHQTDYPEIEAEGQTHAEACGRLIELLVQAGDFASEAWRCQPLGLALIDARAFNRTFTGGTRARPILPPLDVTRPGPPAPSECRYAQ
jgi:hypothetical protein